MTDPIGARFFARIAAHRPRVLATLRGPASAAQLSTLELTLGASLPRELRELYLTHDGQELTSEPLGIFGRWSWLSLDHCLQVRDGVRATFAAPATWLPIGVDSTANYLVVDLAAGTVIEWLRDDEHRAPSEPPSFGVWLAREVESLERDETSEASVATGNAGRTSRALVLVVTAVVLVIALLAVALASR